MTPPGGGERRNHALLGWSVPCGWVLHDLFVFANSGRPENALRILTGSVIMVLLGLVAGLFLARRRQLQLALVLALALLSVVPRFVQLPVNNLQEWLPRSLLLCLVLSGLAARLSNHSPIGAQRIGLAFGVLGCMLVNRYRGAPDVAMPVLLLACVLILWDWPHLARWRVAGTCLSVLLTASLVAYKVLESPPGQRESLAPPSAQSVTLGAPNLVLIVLDTLRADRLSSYGHARPTTPEIDAFMEHRATRFTQARSTGSFTLPSHASLFTGLMPAEHGAAFMGLSAQPLHPEVTMLAERLRGVGYQTAAVISNRAYFFPRLGLSRGFEHYDNRTGGNLGDYVALWQFTGLDLPAGHQPYREARAISDAACDWLDRRRESDPFFLFLNYMDAHGPTIPPAPFDRAFESRRPRRPLEPAEDIRELLYDRSLRYMDGQVARVLKKLEVDGLLENTLLVLTSDHGHSLGERDFHGHGRFLFEELVRVPLFIKPVHGRSKELDHLPVTSTDLHNRMLAGLGMGLAEPSRSGFTSEWYHHLDRPDGPWATTTLLTWLTGSRKFIVASDGVVKAFDLEADPGETTPLVLTAEEESKAHERARAWWAAHPLIVEPTEFPAEQVDALRDLGYVGDE